MAVSLESSYACSLLHPSSMYGISCFGEINNSVTLRLFARTPSMIRQIVKLWEVDPFYGKPFWIFMEIFSTSSRIQLRSRIFYTLAVIAVRVMPLLFLGIPRLLFLERRGCRISSVSLLCFVHTQRFVKEEIRRQIALSPVLQGVFRRDLPLFCF